MRQIKGVNRSSMSPPTLASPATGTGLDHRGTLPVLPVTLVVLLGGQGGERERRSARVGPELEIGRIDAALVRPLAQQGSEVAHQAMQGFRGLAPALVAHAFGIEQNDEGKRGRVPELSRAEPPDAEDRQPARRRGLVLVRERQHATRCAGAE